MLEALGPGKACVYNPRSVASISPVQQIANQPPPVRDLPLCRDWRFFLFLALMLAPCFWQSRIQAGDLSSHLYNSWLALQIRSGAVHGLSIVPQWTNVAFDWLLTWLLATFGAGPAQRIAVSLAVLVFGGGALAFVSAASSRRPWFLTPCIAMLAYGFVFHIGFLNFYLSLGICLWFLAAFWKGAIRARVAAVPLLALAWLAHPLPVVWAAGAGAYVLIGRRLTENRQLYLLGLGIAALLATQQVLSARYHTVWSPLQIFGVTGADQAFVYGRKYVVITIGLLLVWLVWLRRLLKEGGWRGLHIPGQLLLLTGAGVVLIPSRIDFPQYAHGLVYIADRMSLASGVLLCGVLAQVRARRAEMFAMAALTAVFFGFLYADGARANRQENQIQEVVEQNIPRYARVVFLSSQWNLRVDPLTHVADRVCIGRCYSYANYEPSTRQFRIRAAQNNGIVVTSYKDSYQLASGDYVVRPQDVPLYQVKACTPGAQEYCVRELRAGEVNGRGGQ
ncbi:MAG TPA: hypothetical protein VI424_05240 [Terriglobales bacterium]